MPDYDFTFVGGVFYTILTYFKQNSHVDEKGKLIPTRNQDVMKGLLEAINEGKPVGVKENTLRTYSTQYKQCKTIKSSYFFLENYSFAEKYSNQVHTKDGYKSCVENMTVFLRSYIDISKKELLVKAILEQIQFDDKIPPSQHFYIDGHDIPVTKMQMLNMSTFSLPEFMVGTVNYIMYYCRGRNEEGLHTLDILGGLESRGRRDLKDFPFGQKITHFINVSFPELVNPILQVSKSILLEQTDENGHIHPLSRALANMTMTVSRIPLTTADGLVVNFDEIFVPVNLSPRANRAIYSKDTVSDPTIEKLLEISTKNIILGRGGAGKTMNILTLFLHASADYPATNIFPALVDLRDYKTPNESLVEFVTRILQTYCADVTPEMIEKKIKTESISFLLDGLDEMDRGLVDNFSYELDLFMRQNPTTPIILSSRETQYLSMFPQFTKWDCEDLTIEQAVEIVRKYPSVVSQAMKEKFIKSLYKYLYEEFYQFAGNPLLLMVMLRTFDRKNGAPIKDYEIFREAFITLYKTHDEGKRGFRRVLYTSLSIQDFQKYFSCFCFLISQHKLTSLSRSEFLDHMQIAIDWENDMSEGRLCARPIDFLYDIKYNIGIMFEEKDKFYFLHDAFQQYFTAYFFTDHWSLKKIFYEYFAKRKGVEYKTDDTIDMLHSMRKTDVELEIFYPYLKEHLDICRKSPDPFWTYMYMFHRYITVARLPNKDEIETSYRFRKILAANIEPTCSQSYLYEAFMHIMGFSQVEKLNKWKWPAGMLNTFPGELFYWDYDYDSASEYGELKSDEMVAQSWDLKDIRSYNKGVDRVVGYYYVIDTKTISESTLNGELMRNMEKKDFPLRVEFDLLCQWVDKQTELIEKQVPRGTQLIDALGFNKK